MSRWASRMCSSRCHGVYGTFGGRVLMCSMGKLATASSKVMYDGPWTRFRTSARTASFLIAISRASRGPGRPGRYRRECLEGLRERSPEEDVLPPAGPDQMWPGDPELLRGQLRRFVDVLDHLEAA